MHALNQQSKLPSGITLLILLLLCGINAQEVIAANAKTTQEVNHLLSYLESSGCGFNRNGSWYTAKKARAHLEQKFQYLDKRSLIGTSEDFIVRAASSSSMSGHTYQVLCAGGKAVSSADWLGAELKRFRAGQLRR